MVLGFIHRALFASGGTRGLIYSSYVCVYIITEGFRSAVTGRLDDALTAGRTAFCAQQSLSYVPSVGV